MRNRRQFLKAVAYAGAGSMILGQAPIAMAKSHRKTVSIGGLPATTVDIHAHCEIKAVERVVRGTPLEMSVRSARLLGPARIEEMDERGIDIQAIHIGNYWWYEADKELARKITRVMNEGMAEWVADHPDRFVALAAVSLQHPELAAEELEYAVTKLGHRGASIGGHVLGEIPSSAKYDPFWAKVDELDVPVFMHPGGADFLVDWDKVKTSGDPSNIIGNPLETTIFLSGLIFDGTFDRHPRAKVVGAHSGGYLPSYSGRAAVACEARGEDAACANQKGPRDYLRENIFVDSMIFTEEGLRHLVAEMGASQILYGTDIPYHWPDTLDLIVDAKALSNAEKEAIVGGNARRLLRIS